MTHDQEEKLVHMIGELAKAGHKLLARIEQLEAKAKHLELLVERAQTFSPLPLAMILDEKSL